MLHLINHSPTQNLFPNSKSLLTEILDKILHGTYFFVAQLKFFIMWQVILFFFFFKKELIAIFFLCN